MCIFISNYKKYHREIPYALHQLSLTVTFCKIQAGDHSQDINKDIYNPLTSPDFSNFICLHSAVCVCLILQSFILYILNVIPLFKFYFFP